MPQERNHSRPAGAPTERREGFTLVEILVVVAILGIIAAVAVPHAVGTRDLQVISAARTVATDLEYAQNVAITTQKAVTVTFSVSEESYSLSNQSGLLNHPMTKGPYSVDFRFVPEFRDVDVLSASFGGSAAVTFDDLGSPSSAGSITLRAGPHVYRVDLAAATGRVTVAAVSP